MGGILEIEEPPAVRFFPQIAQPLLPDPPPLILQPPPIAGLLRGRDVVWQVFPPAAGRQHVQNAIEDLSLVDTRASSSLGAWHKPFEAGPLGVT